MFAVAISPLFLAAAARADDSAAHAIAEKFSRAEDAERAAAEKKAEEKKKAEAEKARAEAKRQAERRKAADEQRTKDEAEMLDRARAEDDARRQAEERAAEQARIESERQAARAEAEKLAREAEQGRAEEARKAEEARQAEAARLAKEVDDKRLADERQAEEARQADAARIAKETEARKAEEARQAEDARIAKEAEDKRVAEQRRTQRLAKEAEEKRRTEAARKAEEQRQADAAREALERQRTEEAERVAEKFRLAREAREAKRREADAAARERGTDTRDSLGGPTADAQTPPAPWDTPNDAPARYLPTRVTILLVMDPRHRVFATYPPTGNPVLCIDQGCYISGGANGPSEYMPRFAALGPANSIGRRAGPCRNQLTCVFRDVELGGGYAQIQPVDMGLLHHDRREIRGVRPDPTCDILGGRLFCGEPVVAKGYRAWIVPEVIATKAGPDALREALTLGLPTARSATLDPWRSVVHAESSR
jgi:colicin import membrane protein